MVTVIYVPASRTVPAAIRPRPRYLVKSSLDSTQDREFVLLKGLNQMDLFYNEVKPYLASIGVTVLYYTETRLQWQSEPVKLAGYAGNFRSYYGGFPELRGKPTKAGSNSSNSGRVRPAVLNYVLRIEKPFDFGGKDVRWMNGRWEVYQVETGVPIELSGVKVRLSEPSLDTVMGDV